MDAWGIKVFQRHRDDDPLEECPTEDFFRECPNSVANDLFAIIEAVAAGPPPRFRGGPVWQAMRGAMSGYYEARTRGPDRRLYRLFCILERQAPGLDEPSVVLICGLWKAHGTAFTDADYAQVRRLGDEYRGRVPRNVV
jgi:hypothetical protein